MPKTSIQKLKGNASPSPGGGKSSSQLVRAQNQWRDNYNPLRGLVISKVVYLLESAERGDYAELELTVRKIEKRYPVLKGLKTRRLSALEELDWDIKIRTNLPAGGTQAMAEAQQKYLRSRYELIKNLTEVFGFLALAEFRGFSILQKHRFTDGENDGAVQELHWLPQWTFCRDGQFGDWYYNKDSRFGIGIGGCKVSLGESNRIGSVDLPREEFVIREVEDSLFEIALIAFVNWAMARKDFAAFVEIFGLPNGVVIMPPNIQPGQEASYQASAEKVADGVSGALPNGSDIKFPTSSFRNNGPFKEFCDVQDADVVMAGTGGRLAMLTAEHGGLGSGPSKQHSDAFEQIARADARKINQVLQTDFDAAELNEAFAGQPHCVYFELFASDVEDVKEFCTNVNVLALAGKTVTSEFVAEKTGYEMGPDVAPKTLADETAQLPGEPASVKNRISLRNRDSASTDVATTIHEMLIPLLDRIDKINKAIDASVGVETIQQMVEKLLKDFPHIEAVIKSDNSLAKKISPQMQDALLAGLNKKEPTKA